jgi:hypothetical protein
MPIKGAIGASWNLLFSEKIGKNVANVVANA